MVTPANAAAAQNTLPDPWDSLFGPSLPQDSPASHSLDSFLNTLTTSLANTRTAGLPLLVRLSIGLSGADSGKDSEEVAALSPEEFFAKERAMLDELESEMLVSATESPEKAQEQLAVVEGLAQKYSQLSQQSSDENDQEQYLRLALSTYDTLYRVSDWSPFEEIKGRRDYYAGCRMLNLGEFEGAKAAFEIAKGCPEAKAILEKMSRDSDRMRNLGALDVWMSYVEEGQAHDMDEANGGLGVAAGTVQFFVEGDHKTLLDKVAEKWNVDRDLIHEVRVKLRNDQATTVEEALAQLIDETDSLELKSRASALLAQGKQYTDNGSTILGHLIRYAATAEPDSNLTQDLLHDADQIGARESAVQVPYGICSFLKATNPAVKEHCEQQLTAIEKGKNLPDQIWDLLRTTGTDDLAQIAIMHGATKVGSFAKIAALGRLEKLGVTGYKALGIAYGTEVLSEGTAMWAMNTAYDAMGHDPDKVFDTHRLLNSWGANLIMVGGLKATGALSRKYAPKIAAVFGQVREGQLTRPGQGMVAGINHLAGVTGMVGTGQLNQALELSDRPKGGFQESLVNDVFTYIKYGIADKGVDHVLGADHVAAREQRQQEIERKQENLLKAAKQSQKIEKPRTKSTPASDLPLTLKEVRRTLKLMESPLLASLWMLMGVDGPGGAAQRKMKSEILANDPPLKELSEQVLTLQDKNPEDPTLAEHYSVIADRLQELGDSRGEWIALEMKRQQLQRHQADLMAIAALESEITKIRGQIEGDIKARFGLVVDYQFDAAGGFQLTLEGDKNSKATSEFFSSFLQSEYSVLLTRLQIFNFNPNQEWILSDSNLNHLTGLRELKVVKCNMMPNQTRAIANSRALFQLKSLALVDNFVLEEGVQAIAASQALSNLQSLELVYSYFGDGGAQAIATSQTLSNLQSLNLGRNFIGDEGARAIAASQTLLHLQSLNLGDNRIEDEGARAIASSPTLSNLQSLNLGLNLISDEGARAIAESPYLSNLETLDGEHVRRPSPSSEENNSTRNPDETSAPTSHLALAGLGVFGGDGSWWDRALQLHHDLIPAEVAVGLSVGFVLGLWLLGKSLQKFNAKHTANTLGELKKENVISTINRMVEAGWTVEQQSQFLSTIDRTFQSRSQNFVAYIFLPFSISTMKEAGWKPKEQFQFLTQLTERRATPMEDREYDRLRSLLRVMGDVGWSPEEQFQLLSSLAGQVKSDLFDEYDHLSKVISGMEENGWDSQKQFKLLSGLAEDTGKHPTAFRLACLIFSLSDPDHIRTMTGYVNRLFEKLTEDGISNSFNLFLEHKELFRELGPKRFKGHFLFYVQVLERWLNPGFGIVEALIEATGTGLIPRDLSGQRWEIFDFIEQSHGFVPGFYAAYLKKREGFFVRLKASADAIRADVFTLQDAQRVIREQGEDFLLGLIQMVSPPSGASFVESKSQLDLLRKTLKTGDHRGHIPEAWRGKTEFFDLELRDYQLKPGEVADPENKIGQLLDTLKAESSELNDEVNASDLTKALKGYLENGRSREGREQVRKILYQLAGQEEEFRNRVQAIHSQSYLNLGLLEQLFRNKDNLPKLLAKGLEQLPPELGALKANKQSIKGDAKNIVKSLKKVWSEEIGGKTLGHEQKIEILASILKAFDEQDIEAKILSRDDLEPELTSAIREVMHEAPTLGRKQIVDEILAEPMQWIQDEKAKYHYASRGTLRMGLRAVKGPAYGLHGQSSGVCIASDLKLWNNPNFKLLAIRDEDRGEVVGYIHVFEIKIKGKKYLTLPGINPSEEFMATVNAKELYPKLMEKVKAFAEAGGYAAVLIPTNPNIHSNRTEIQKEIQKSKYPIQRIPVVNWSSEPYQYPFDEVYAAWGGI